MCIRDSGAALDEPLAFEAALAAALVALLAADVPESEPIEHPVSVRAATALDASIARLIVIRLVVRWRDMANPPDRRVVARA